MRNHEVYEFTVQVYERDKDGGRALQDAAERVSAMSPVGAASKLLGESLSPIGNVTALRAKVWRIGPDDQPIVTLLYRRG